MDWKKKLSEHLDQKRLIRELPPGTGTLLDGRWWIDHDRKKDERFAVSRRECPPGRDSRIFEIWFTKGHVCTALLDSASDASSTTALELDNITNSLLKRFCKPKRYVIF